ncbi:MAG: hypothetical protein NVSMB2_08500 [Chloroflexota bacterium]
MATPVVGVTTVAVWLGSSEKVERGAMEVAPRDGVLIVPGLNGHPGMLLKAAPTLLAEWEPLAFNHHRDLAAGGVEALADRALRVIGDRDSAWVCGESFGGTVALTLAHRYPARVKGLILLSAFGWHPSRLARHGARALALWSFLGHRVNDDLYRAGRLASVATQLGWNAPRQLVRGYLSRPRAHVLAYRTKAELSLTFDARPWLGTVEAPTLIVSGSYDAVVPPSAGRDLARRLPNARLLMLPGGHLVHLVQAARVGAVVSDWARDMQ